MLNADVVGFHAFDHARHFLNACKRVIGLSYHNKDGCVGMILLKPRLLRFGRLTSKHSCAASRGLIGIEFESRTVTVLISHVGIEGSLLTSAMEEEHTVREAEAIRAKHPGG